MQSNQEQLDINFEAKLLPEDFTDDFKNIVNDYKCPLCQGVYFNPYVDKCGHVFCKECIYKYLDQFHQCPLSKYELNVDNLNKLVFMSEILEKQLVKCKNRNFDCDWKGRLCELESHINVDCKKQKIICPHRGCEKIIFREEKEPHILLCDYRTLACEFCEISISFIDLKNHFDVCPKFVMDCLQKCGKQVERKDLTHHIEEDCMNTIIDCPFNGIGCDFTCSKKELSKHFKYSSAEHMLFMYSLIIKTQKNSNAVKQNIFNAISKFQDKVNNMDPNLYNFQIYQEEKNIITENYQLISEIRNSLNSLVENDLKNHYDVFSQLKVGFILNNKKKEELKNEVLNKDILEMNIESQSKYNSITNNEGSINTLELNENPIELVKAEDNNASNSSKSKLLGNKRRKNSDYEHQEVEINLITINDEKITIAE